jgi:hypothetical protein
MFTTDVTHPRPQKIQKIKVTSQKITVVDLGYELQSINNSKLLRLRSAQRPPTYRSDVITH